MVKLSANIAGFLFLLLAFLLLIGMQLVLVSSLESRMERLQRSHAFWARGVHLDLLNKMAGAPRTEVMHTLRRELAKTPEGCCGQQGASLRQAVKACARKRHACAGLQRQMELVRAESQSRFNLFSNGGNLVMVALALAFLGLGGTLAWMARGSLRLLAVLGGLCWSASLGLQIHLFSVDNRQVMDATSVARLVTRTRLAITLAPATMRTELDRLLTDLRQARGIPPPQRGPLELSLRKCIQAAQNEMARQARCRRTPRLCFRPRVNQVAVACPRVMISLARAQAASRGAPLGNQSLVWLVSWLQISSVLLLLLLLLLAGMDKRRRHRARDGP